MRVVFMGTPDYAWVILKRILKEKDIDVVAVFTQPDKPVGRGKVLTPPFVKSKLISKDKSIKIYQPKSLRDEEIIKKIILLKPDFIVVAAYGQILPKEILNIAPCINLHASILPKYRGASPIQSSLLNEDRYSGVTAMLMDEGLDTGDILGYSFIKIEKEVMVSKLFEKLSLMASDLCIKVLKEFKNIKPLKQFNALSSYSKKIIRDDGLVTFENAKELMKKYRAYHPWPGIFLENSLKIKKLSLVSKDEKYIQGEILDIENEKVIVGCASGSIALEEVQPPSKKVMSAKEYIVGKRLKVGDKIL